MLGLSLSSQKEQYYVLFDIGSASIGVGIAVASEHTTSLLWSKRLEYGYLTDDDYNRYVRTMYATLLDAGMKLTSEGVKAAQLVNVDFSIRQAKVFCLLAPPWFKASVQLVSEVKEKPFQATASLLGTLQAQGLSEVLAKEETRSWKELMGDTVCLEQHPDSIRLEGYPVTQYEHRMTHEFAVQSYYSLVSQSVQEHIQEVIGRILPNHTIQTSTSTRVFSTKCSKKSKRERQHLLFEIGGELTSVGHIKKGFLQDVVTVPLGTNHILRALAPNAQSANEARSAFEVLNKKHNPNLEFESLPVDVQEALTRWHESVMRSIEVLAKGVTPPSRYRVVVDTVWFSLFSLALTKPWMMPGIQQAIEPTVSWLDFSTEAQEEITNQDVRLVMYVRALHSCTSKNSMCYTGNNT